MLLTELEVDRDYIANRRNFSIIQSTRSVKFVVSFIFPATGSFCFRNVGTLFSVGQGLPRALLHLHAENAAREDAYHRSRGAGSDNRRPHHRDLRSGRRQGKSSKSQGSRSGTFAKNMMFSLPCLQAL